jgi:hypothetical protein
MAETTDEQKVENIEENNIFNTFTDGINLVASLFSEETIAFREKMKETKENFTKYFEKIPNKEENEEISLQMEEISSLIDATIANLQISLEESARILTGALQISQKINPDNNKAEEEENS